VDLSAATDELYGVAPEEFVATRKRLASEAKKAGDAGLAKRIGALRRPTLAAWAVNQLARSASTELGWLFDVGAHLRSAWESGTHMGGMDQRRSEVVNHLVRTARSLAAKAGRPLREQALREVEETLHAATMDPEVAGEVGSGRLTQPRSHVGFGPVGGLAGQPPPPRPDEERQRVEEERRRGEERQHEEEQRREREQRHYAEQARAAATAAREAERSLAERESEVAALQRTRADAAEDVQRLRSELQSAVRRDETAAQRLSAAEQGRTIAARRVEEAHRRSDEAQSRL
jgi:hypothetical protein